MLEEAVTNILLGQSAFKRLSVVQRKVVDERLGELAEYPLLRLHGFDTRCAKKFGVTREAVRQQRKKAEGRLKKFFISWEVKKNET